MNVARLNFSHGSYENHEELLSTIREAATESQKVIGVLQDLQGPRIRTGNLPEAGIEIEKGTEVVLMSQDAFDAYTQKEGMPTALPIQYPQLAKDVEEKSRITIQDGLIDLRVLSTTNNTITCTVKQGGIVKSHKGINAPGTTIEGDVITGKDKEDIQWGVKHNVDYIALSFVKSAQDINDLRALLPQESPIRLIAKIERQEAVDDIDNIIEAADGIMIARGDLGVELGTEVVPVLQKQIALKCLRAGVPVIVATQMLESMTESSRPTRAEAADVANAVIDHADALMLSAESATGKYPVKAVQSMSKIIRATEKSPLDDIEHDEVGHHDDDIAQGTAHAAVHLAQSIEAKAIVLESITGRTASLVSQLRPEQVRIIALSHNQDMLRKLALVWGVRLVQAADELTTTDAQTMHDQMRAALMEHHHAKEGQQVVIISGSRESAGLTAVEAIVV